MTTRRTLGMLSTTSQSQLPEQQHLQPTLTNRRSFSGNSADSQTPLQEEQPNSNDHRLTPFIIRITAIASLGGVLFGK